MRNNALKLAGGTLLFISFIFLTGFLGPKGDSAAEKRETINKMRRETLADLYKLRPAARDEIKRAVGYAVFSNVGVNLFVVSTGNGYGVAHDNKTGKDIYMKMLSGGVGVGLGVKDFRGIFIFSDRAAFTDFVEHGWTAQGQADAAAQADDKGGSAAAAIEVGPGIRLYQITKNGLALQATIQGTKYWKADKLN